MITKTTLKNKVLEYLDVILFLLIVPYKISIFAGKVTGNAYNQGITLYPAIASVVVVGAIAFAFKNKHRTRILYTINIIVSSFLIADTVYYRYYKDVISLGAMRSGLLLGGVKDSVGSLIKPYDFLYLVDIFIFIPLLRLYRKVERKEYKLKFRLAAFALVLLIGISLDSVSIIKLSNEQPRLITTMVNRIYLTNVLGDLNFHILDVYNVCKNSIDKHKKLDAAKETSIKQVLSSNVTKQAGKLTGVAKGKNLIVIQVEALQQFAIGSKINGQEVTPNLNKWLKQCEYFDNYFYQVSAGNTSDAEFLSNNSLYPAASGAAYYMYDNNDYNSLAKVLEGQGYYTAALHANREGFWNRNVMYKAEDFNNFYGEHSYTIDEKVGLGLSDKSFLQQAMTKIKTFKQPFYSFVITLSSHYPFDDVKGYGDFNVGDFEGNILGNYLKGIHYTDAQLGMFLDMLQKEGYMDNSIVVLYGDHNAMQKNNFNDLCKFLGTQDTSELNWSLLQKVPLYIHFPGDANKGVNHTYGGQVDLFPTLANMFSLTNQYMLGKDLNNPRDGMVMFRNGSFTDGKTYYISSSDKYYDILTGTQVIQTQQLKDEKQKTLDTLEDSDDILNHNLIGKFSK